MDDAEGVSNEVISTHFPVSHTFCIDVIDLCESSEEDLPNGRGVLSPAQWRDQRWNNASGSTPQRVNKRGMQYRIVDSDKGLVVLHNRESIGTLVATSQKNTYLVNTTKISGIAYRTDDGFKIETPVAGQSDLMVMKFVKNAQ